VIKSSLIIIGIITIILISGCVSKNSNLIKSQEKTLDILLEEKLNSKVPSYTKYIDVTNVKKDDNLTIEYIAYAGGFAPNIYEHMTNVFTFLDNYLNESGESYNSIKLVAIGFQTGDQYTLVITREELSKFVSGGLGFEQWNGMVNITYNHA